MKCNKCGYVSFDYLSECKKCGVSLEATREGLGFGTAKPNMPSFLGSLLKDYVQPPEESVKAEPESSFSFDFGEDFDPADVQLEDSSESENGDEVEPATLLRSQPDPALDALEAGLGMEPEPQSGGPSPVHATGAASKAEHPEGEDFALLDITDEEMDLLIASDDDEKVVEARQPLKMEEHRQTGSADSEKTAQMPAMDNEPEELNAVSRPKDLSLEEKDAGGLIPKFDVSALPGLSDRPVSAEPETSEAKAVTVEDNGLEIALSEKDLKTLLADLEVASRKKEEKRD